MKETTVIHLMVEKLKDQGINILFDKKFQGNLIQEHNWGMADPNGPKLIHTYPELFQKVCKEIDEGIANGSVVFDDETGIITFL